MGEIQQDPSMEEILASIKRVIAEDGRAGATAGAVRRERVEPAAAPARPSSAITRLMEASISSIEGSC